MKKIYLSLAVVLAFASIASAATSDISAVTGITFKPSSNVIVMYASDTGKQNYVLDSKHTAGDKTFSTSNNTSTVWFTDTIAAGTALTAGAGMQTPGESTYSGWSSQ